MLCQQLDWFCTLVRNWGKYVWIAQDLLPVFLRIVFFFSNLNIVPKPAGAAIMPGIGNTGNNLFILFFLFFSPSGFFSCWSAFFSSSSFSFSAPCLSFSPLYILPDLPALVCPYLCVPFVSFLVPPLEFLYLLLLLYLIQKTNLSFKRFFSFTWLFQLLLYFYVKFSLLFWVFWSYLLKLLFWS